MGLRLNREFWEPKKFNQLIERDELEAKVYFPESMDGKYLAMGFSGKRAKPDFHYNFKTPGERENYVGRYFENLAANIQRKLDYKSRAKVLSNEFLESLKPGVILYDTWGYDQTNVEFYKVIERKGSKVLIQELGCTPVGEPTSWASDRVVAGGPTDAAPIWKNVRSQCVRICSSVSLRIWDGKELHRSWYA